MIWPKTSIELKLTNSALRERNEEKWEESLTETHPWEKGAPRQWSKKTGEDRETFFPV